MRPRRYRIGVREVSYGVLMTAPGPSATWAWDCLYPRPYAARIAELESQHGLPRGLLFAIMRQESAFDPSAESPVGARGLMQLMPYTAERVAAELGTTVAPGDLDRPAKNLELGARYLARLVGELGGSLPLAVASYNAGPRAVSRWVAAGHGARRRSVHRAHPPTPRPAATSRA
jgi:soluble lytic murein transglycosylase